MSSEYNIAIAGATGVVGTTLIELLKSSSLDIASLTLLASARSAGKKIDFNGKQIEIKDLDKFDFNNIDIAFFSAGGSVSEKYVPKAVAAGAIVIDNTSHYRYDDDIPLIVPGVNSQAINNHKNKSIIANPNCSTAQMVMPLKPINDKFGIERINVATYQAVSGTGQDAVQELMTQTRQIIDGQDIDPPKAYPQQIAFNALPHIDTFQDNGYTREEMKMVWETQKIFGDKTIQVNPTAVRVPVVNAHSMAVHIETKDKLSVQQAEELIAQMPGVELMNHNEPNGYPTAIANAQGHNPVYVGRIREDISHPRGLNLWIVADNLRRGAALNALEIAQLIAK